MGKLVEVTLKIDAELKEQYEAIWFMCRIAFLRIWELCGGCGRLCKPTLLRQLRFARLLPCNKRRMQLRPRCGVSFAAQFCLLAKLEHHPLLDGRRGKEYNATVVGGQAT